jgi:hypothetical protein
MEGRLPGRFTNGDRTADTAAEIATVRQQLAAAEARIQEMGGHDATEADKDNAFKLFTSWKASWLEARTRPP